MKQLFILFALYALISCNSEKKNERVATNASSVANTRNEKVSFKSTSFQFSSPREQADSLISFMNKAQGASNTAQWEYKFFHAFPNSFSEMQALFGYDQATGEAPLYTTTDSNKKYHNKGISSHAIGFFSALTSIPDSIYYRKYVNINIGGKWEADNIREAFGFHYKLINDAKSACTTLSTFSDDDIKSIFRFIFDGPHPKNPDNEKLFLQLIPILERQDLRLSQLLAETYHSLMQEDADHQH